MEIVCTGDGTVGSNPTLSAIQITNAMECHGDTVREPGGVSAANPVRPEREQRQQLLPGVRLPIRARFTAPLSFGRVMPPAAKGAPPLWTPRRVRILWGSAPHPAGPLRLLFFLFFLAFRLVLSLVMGQPKQQQRCGIPKHNSDKRTPARSKGRALIRIPPIRSHQRNN